MSDILFHEYGTELRREEDGRLILNVLCGRVGQYGVEFPLNEVETQHYHSGGVDFIKELSRKVYQNPDLYLARGRAR